jgi:4-alpha-glucanotransferase
VGEFRRAHEREIDAHRWAQFELDRQLGEAGRLAGRRLPIGLLTDLAVGCAPWGADPWGYPTLFAAGATVGAPPDDYSVQGQDWGFPPLDPRRLAAQDFTYWRAVVRHAMRHAGAVRLDHAMGLYRQFWIPEGGSPADGAYVTYPAPALFAVLAAESRRRGAIVIGEDLGTVPRGFAARLARWGVLSTRVLYFERARTGYRPARRYSRRALVTATTHDHAPVAGFWEGTDLGLRRAAGNIPSEGMLEHLEAERRRDRQLLVARLTRDDALKAADTLDAESVIRGAYRFLASTPAPLVGVMLDDLAAEREPVNLPGVPQERFPSWTRRMRRSLEELERDELAATVLADIRTVRGSR